MSHPSTHLSSRPRRYLAGKAASVFPSLASASPDALYHAMNQLTDPPLIRVESDEVQYPLHIVLR